MNDNAQTALQKAATASRPPMRSLAEGAPAPQAAGPQPPLVVRPLHSLALQVPLLLVVALSLVVTVGAWGLREIVLRSFERLEVANAELDLRRFANAVDQDRKSTRLNSSH